MSGWNLPPGVTSRMIDEAMGVDQPCDVCGAAVDDCVCPECSVCHAHGDPECYALTPEGHGLKYTREQLDSRAERERLDKLEEDRCRAEAEYFADPQRKVEEAEYLALMEKQT